jgi:hypothetical protein
MSALITARHNMEDMLLQEQPQQMTPVVQPTPQPVFYSVTPETPPPPPPWYKRRQVVVFAACLILAALVLGLVAVFAANIFKSNRLAKQEAEDKAKQVEQMIESGTSQSEAARQAAFVEGCKGLSGEAYTNCVSLIAFDSGNSAVCTNLSGADKTACEDGATLVKAKAGKDYKACDAITDEILRNSCQAALRTQAAAADDCAGYGVPLEYCDTQKAIEAAIASGNPASCDALAEDARGICADLFTSIDADKDGLSLAEEYQIGTSDQKADTDGDGYTDGEEVISGHDPLKK